MKNTCEFCYKEFPSKWGLKRHLLIHTGEKPYACTLCYARFNQKIVLKRHCERIHAPPAAVVTDWHFEKKIKCLTLPPRFEISHYLRYNLIAIYEIILAKMNSFSQIWVILLWWILALRHWDGLNNAGVVQCIGSIQFLTMWYNSCLAFPFEIG
jgi:hypothetical protein